ncbi:Disulfide bond formation protein D precursor [Pseudoruegeria aquimaris]|uniref:Disulfide bond formation protein D n=1 Tax=Pseudoruegeria aquimaris TaxID=393663 RepID=A0A1Y5R8F7_9RHOB|nr:DsbA family protein [Pseudoruegeria aquimaris]SLN11543.1 Disulfide bond formation protein D precursor [Pseudoruegeria aquimaris]
MKRLLLAGAALAALASSPAAAFDISAMSDAERGAFREEVRSYLLENPELLLEVIAVLEKQQAEAQATGDQQLIQTNATALFEDENSWVGGNPEGDVVLVEFMDYRCGYCKKAFEEVEALLESDGNIRFIVKEFPILGEESEMAARFAIATLQLEGDAAYKAVHDDLMTMRGQVSEGSLAKIGRAAGIDVEAVKAHMDSDDVSSVIAENRALAARLNISGTPGFVLGDTMLRGYLPLDAMREVVKEIRTQ